MKNNYDQLGVKYNRTREPDPRIAACSVDALADCGSMVNVGGGTGAYEPRDRVVTAVEPSMTMIRQRPPDAAPVLLAAAENLPLQDKCVDAAVATVCS